MAEENDTMPEGMAAECYAAFLESEELSVMNELRPMDGRKQELAPQGSAPDDSAEAEERLSAELSDIIMRAERLRDELPSV